MKKHRETKLVAGLLQMLDILDREGVSTKPVYVGFGLEVYQNDTTQVTYDCRNNVNLVTIKRGV